MPDLVEHDHLLMCVTETVMSLRGLNVREERIVLPSNVAKDLLKRGSTYLGMEIVSSDTIPPMVMSSEQFGRFVPISVWA